MAVRPPQNLARVINPETGLSMVEAEMLAETAASLGHHGKKVETALRKLQECDEETRATHTNAAARAVWEYFIQRELCGMRDHRLIIKEMQIPQTVLNMLGSVKL
jgi:hypothetical protein